MMNRPPLEEVKRGSKADYRELYRVDYAKVFRAVKLPLLLILYGWVGVSLLGVLIKALAALEEFITPPLLGSIVSTSVFAVVAISWLYIWRKLAVYYRNKYLRSQENR